jgi:hypothetical protein
VHEGRSKVLAEAFNAHPERFVRGMPQARMIPDAVWINPPLQGLSEEVKSLNS